MSRWDGETVVVATSVNRLVAVRPHSAANVEALDPDIIMRRSRPLSGFQGEVGAGRRQGLSNTGSIGGAVRRASQSDHVVESAA